MEIQSVTTEPCQFHFPYFGHQQLDPDIFPVALGLPIAKPGRAPRNRQSTGTDSRIRSWGGGEYVDCLSIEADTQQTNSDTQFRHKHIRIPGGRPAIAKRVTADLDSDDEVIVRMKNAKFLEKDIAQRLMDEGRIKYNAKTIGTRYTRLRKKIEGKTDELLALGLTDWHDGDDAALAQAKHQADLAIDKAIDELENKRWKMVSENLKSLKPVTNFSKVACKERYESLQNGTASATPESFVEPDEEVASRIQARREGEARIESDKLLFRSTIVSKETMVT